MPAKRKTQSAEVVPAQPQIRWFYERISTADEAGELLLAIQETKDWLEREVIQERRITGDLRKAFAFLIERIETEISLHCQQVVDAAYDADKVKVARKTVTEIAKLRPELDRLAVDLRMSPARMTPAVARIGGYLRILREINPELIKVSPADGRDGIAASEPCTHTDDFSTVMWYGEQYSFNQTEAKCVALLWAEWEKNPTGKMALHQKTIRDGICSESESFRLSLVFRHKRKQNDAWESMIHSMGDGRFYLAKPEPKKKGERKGPRKQRITQ